MGTREDTSFYSRILKVLWTRIIKVNFSFHPEKATILHHSTLWILRIDTIDLSLLVTTQIKAVSTIEWNILLLEFVNIVECYITGITNNLRVGNIKLELCAGRIENSWFIWEYIYHRTCFKCYLKSILYIYYSCTITGKRLWDSWSNYFHSRLWLVEIKYSTLLSIVSLNKRTTVKYNIFGFRKSN